VDRDAVIGKIKIKRVFAKDAKITPRTPRRDLNLFLGVLCAFAAFAFKK
jgi:hypothetical protein